MNYFLALLLPNQLYIDYETFGRDVRISEGGTFGENGYIRQDGDISGEYYGTNVPKEYHIYPNMSEKEQEIKVIIVEPKKEAKEIVIENSLKSFYEQVGGVVEDRTSNQVENLLNDYSPYLNLRFYFPMRSIQYYITL